MYYSFLCNQIVREESFETEQNVYVMLLCMNFMLQKDEMDDIVAANECVCECMNEL